MSFYEFTGKSVKEAIAKACEELNMEEALLEVEVLEESTRGFLGIVGQRDARVRVRKRNILREVLEAEEPEPEPQQEPFRQETAEELESATECGPESVEKETKPQRSPIPDHVMAEARDVLQRILEKIPVEAQTEASIAEGAIYLEIKGDGSGLLIGKKGQTLDALQYLVNKIINKENPPGEKIEVVVDTENYRMRKKENLRDMAVKMSQKAKKTLKPVSFNPMPPHERRIIHLILAEDREVYTKSYGEGALRRIIVYPRRGTASKRRRH